MFRRVVTFAEGVLALAGWLFIMVVLAMLLGSDVYVPADTAGRVGYHIRGIEFDYVDWTVAAVAGKLRQSSVAEQDFLDEAVRVQQVRDFFALRQELEGVEAQIAQRYADPEVSDAASATAGLAARAADLRLHMRREQPTIEAVLQEQLSVILAEQGLTLVGQPVPPVSFHMTPLPYALIVSPRTEIRQAAHIDVSGELTLEEQVQLEDRIAADLDVSTLLVPLGGIGTYPTMVAQSSDLNWMASVIAHEWIHNYLTLRPLGMSYLASPELLTMNETTAEMTGNELGALVIQRYYPDLAPPARPFTQILYRDRPPEQQPAPTFSFQAEMHETRVTVDRLLAEGRVDAAEAYMEARRRYLWDHGYQIRKLNQAYFAFYGAYAAGDGGAAGADPVGSAVRLLRRRSGSLEQFVDTMAWYTNFEQLRRKVNLPPQ